MKVISNIPPEKDLSNLIIELILTYNITKTVGEIYDIASFFRVGANFYQSLYKVRNGIIVKEVGTNNRITIASHTMGCITNNLIKERELISRYKNLARP